MDVRSGKWEQVVPQGEPPSPRAAHAAAAVGSMVVIQGGIGPAGLASEDLHVLDFTEFDRPRWHRCASALASHQRSTAADVPHAPCAVPTIYVGTERSVAEMLLHVPEEIALNTLADATLALERSAYKLLPSK